MRYNTPGDDLLIGNGGVFSNEAAGTFDIQGDVFVRGAGTGVFNNAGTVLKSGGTTAAGGFDVTLPFNNNGGLLDSVVGALELTGGGVHTGQFRTAGNGVNLNGGTHTFAAGSSIDGPFVFLNGGGSARRERKSDRQFGSGVERPEHDYGRRADVREHSHVRHRGNRHAHSR